jgi:hypothetical protein
MVSIYRAVLLALLPLLGLAVLISNAPSGAAAPMGLPPVLPAASPSPTASCGWQLTASLNPGSPWETYFFSVSTLALTDTWAVGTYTRPSDRTGHSLTEHWDGQQWTVVPSPDADPRFNLLEGVTAIAADDVWAVGYYRRPNGPEQALIEHWDGAAWSLVPSPPVFTDTNILRSVAAVAPDDIWAVGYYCCVQGWTRPLIEHWDGSTWSVIPSPTAGPKNTEFWDVTVFSAHDIWAVGGFTDSTGDMFPLSEHWDGTAWQIVPSPPPYNPYGNYDTYFRGIAGSGPNDIWAVGWQWSGALIEHWDGVSWTILPVGGWGLLLGVTALSPTDAWAVGYNPQPGRNFALTLHWNGICWTEIPSVSPGAAINILERVAASGPNDIWTVGETWNGNGYPWKTLAEHYIGPCRNPPGCPSPTPTATASPTPTGTSTPTASATATPSPSPTVTLCPLVFTDVDPTDPFYAYIRCLACHGLVSGYPCGGPGEPCVGPTNPPYFRPGTNVTRGQLSKILAGAAGFVDPIPSTQQTFADAPPGSPFWLWLERLAGRGAISGYPCGGAGEPCVGPANRPYARPNASATRGQISKIVSSAAGWTETPTAQTFTDVPPGSPFYFYVERLAGRGIVGGYPCGEVGEPCVPPANRPYFRPGNPTTRGQLAKIAVIPFFPGCDPPTLH